MAMKFDNVRSVRKTYPEGQAVKAWKNSAGISMGFKEEPDSELYDPFTSFYSRRDGGYVLVVRKSILELNNITLEVVDD